MGQVLRKEGGYTFTDKSVLVAAHKDGFVRYGIRADGELLAPGRFGKRGPEGRMDRSPAHQLTRRHGKHCHVEIHVGQVTRDSGRTVQAQVAGAEQPFLFCGDGGKQQGPPQRSARRDLFGQCPSSRAVPIALSIAPL